MTIKRIIRHTLTPGWVTRRIFDYNAMEQIETAIAEAELGHSGEICFAIESGLSTREVWVGKTPRQRAMEVFCALHVWDTELNNGVLLYLEMADKDVEVIADRRAAKRISNKDWKAVCDVVENAAKNDKHVDGVIKAINQIGQLLRQQFPITDSQQSTDKNELSNKPTIL